MAFSWLRSCRRSTGRPWPFERWSSHGIEIQQVSERICEQSVDVFVPQVDVKDIVPPTKEEIVEVI